jgi:hypothetical protein
MLRGGWRAVVAGDKLEYGSKLLVDTIPVSERFSVLERNPGAYSGSESCGKRASKIFALIFSVTALDLLM